MINRANTNIKLLNVLTFLSGSRAYEGVLIVYYATITGSFTLAMTVVAIMHVSASLFEVPTGILSDHVGRKRTLVLYFAANLLAVLLFYIATSAEILMIGSAIIGFALAMRSGTLSAFVYENLELLDKTESFKKVEGKRLALGKYALIPAGVIGTILIFLFDIKAAILFTLVMYVFCFLLSFFIKDIKKFVPGKANIYSKLKTAWFGFIHDPALRDISLGEMIARGVGNSEYRFRALFFSAIMPEWLVNLLGMINNLISGIVMQITHWFVHKVGILKTLVHVGVVDRILTTVLILINTVTSGILMNVFTSISFGLRSVAAKDLLHNRYSKEQRATMGSLVGLGGSLIYSVVAIMFGILADHIGLMYTMLFAQLLLLTSPFFFYLGVKKEK